VDEVPTLFSTSVFLIEVLLFSLGDPPPPPPAPPSESLPNTPKKRITPNVSLPMFNWTTLNDAHGTVFKVKYHLGCNHIGKKVPWGLSHLRSRVRRPAGPLPVMIVRNYHDFDRVLFQWLRFPATFHAHRPILPKVHPDLTNLARSAPNLSYTPLENCTVVWREDIVHFNITWRFLELRICANAPVCFVYKSRH
jgi:hypothetical protein